MAKNESTAVNELLHLMATQKPLTPDPSEDLMFRAPTGAQPKQPVGVATMQGLGPLTTMAARATAAQPTMTMQGLGGLLRGPAASAAEADPAASALAMVLPARLTGPRAATAPPDSMPVAAPFETDMPRPATEMTTSDKWYAEGSKLERPDEAFIGTLYVTRRKSSWKTLAARLAAPMAILMVLSVLIGGYFAFGGEGGQGDQGEKSRVAKAATPAKAAAPAKVIEPARPVEASAKVELPPTATALPATFVDVMVTSSPAGATVELVDRGKTSFLGTTPISTALDPSRTYELSFSYPDRPTQLEPLDPAKTRRVDVTLGRAAARTAKAPKRAQAAAVAATAPVAPVALAPAAAAPAAEPADAPAGDGTLMISSKPPCEIYVDGKATGLTTPQRSIALPPGTHRITLINNVEGLQKTIAIAIAPGETTKVIQDLMAP